MKIQIEINGVVHQVEADPETSLLEILRDDLGMTGTKYGCGESMCGACTVLLDGMPTRSCVTALSEIGTSKVITIEGLEKDGRLHAVQQAFIDEGAMQCGYCTSGMIMSAVGLLERTPHPTEDEIIRRMSGNVCRCGTYPRIVAAVQRASKTLGGKK